MFFLCLYICQQLCFCAGHMHRSAKFQTPPIAVDLLWSCHGALKHDYVCLVCNPFLNRSLIFYYYSRCTSWTGTVTGSRLSARPRCPKVDWPSWECCSRYPSTTIPCWSRSWTSSCVSGIQVRTLFFLNSYTHLRVMINYQDIVCVAILILWV